MLTEELQAAKEFVHALEVRIGTSVARAESLTKAFDALSMFPSKNVARRNVVGDGVTHALRHQDSSAVGVSLAVAEAHQRIGLQRPIDQEKKVDSTQKTHQSTSSRTKIQPTKKKSHRSIDKLKSQRQTIDLSSLKSATPKKNGDDAFVVPASPLSPDKRATLPTFVDWGSSQKGDSRPKGWQASSVQSPRQSTQLATPRLGLVRKDVSGAIKSLVGSMSDATDTQIKEALEKLRRIEGSRKNLSAAIEQCVARAAAARSQIQQLEQYAAEMDGQAATLQSVNESGTPRNAETIHTLQAELDRRANRRPKDSEEESIEHGSVEETEKRLFGEKTFGTASLSLDDVLEQLRNSVPEPVAHVDEKGTGAATHSPREPIKPAASRQDKAGAKLEEHSAKLRQFRALAQEEETRVQKWQARASQGPEKSVTGHSPNL